MKCVMVVDSTLPSGLIANTAAVLGLSLGNHIPGLIGPDITDSGGELHKGITAVPIPVLGSNRDELSRIYRACQTKRPDLTVIGFSTIAQDCHTYAEYMALTGERPSQETQYLGLCIYGSRKVVNSLCGQLKLLR